MILRVLFMALVLSGAQRVIGQGRMDQRVFENASDSAMSKVYSQFADELSRLTDISEIKSITKKLQQNVVPEKELLYNRLYRRVYKRIRKI